MKLMVVERKERVSAALMSFKYSQEICEDADTERGASRTPDSSIKSALPKDWFRQLGLPTGWSSRGP